MQLLLSVLLRSVRKQQTNPSDTTIDTTATLHKNNGVFNKFISSDNIMYPVGFGGDDDDHDDDDDDDSDIIGTPIISCGIKSSDDN
jgi:hypothetical protein